MTIKPIDRRPTFTLREVFLVITAICLGLGGYRLGSIRAEKAWHLHGYAEAEDHYQVMLSSYAECKQTWDEIGTLWREYPNMTIIGSSFAETPATDEQWKAFVQYHAQRNGWKDAGVFKRLEEREREYARELTTLHPECCFP